MTSIDVLDRRTDWACDIAPVLPWLKSLPSGKVHMWGSSPPYYGLRSYLPKDHPDKIHEIGTEPTPEEYVSKMVEIFGEAHRVMHDSGVFWLNLGDSYATGWSSLRSEGGGGFKDNERTRRGNPPAGWKNKDLYGIPWLVARAMQAPRYYGQIKRECDRHWMAAIVDGEGSISGFTHVRKDDGTTRTGIHITITNANRDLLDRAFQIYPTSRHEHNVHGLGHLGTMPTFRWIVHSVEKKAQFLREIYPYLIAKKKQAMLAWNFLEMSKVSKRNTAEQSVEMNAKRAWIVDAISRLNHFQAVDPPNWIKEPPSCYEQGWYLRQWLPWVKWNAMAESVEDRPGSACESIFLLSKSSNYYYDHIAVRRPDAGQDMGNKNGYSREERVGKEKGGQVNFVAGSGRNFRNNDLWFDTAAMMFNDDGDPLGLHSGVGNFKGAHFASFPREMIEPLILCGSSERGVCPTCGSPWERQVESERVATRPGYETKVAGSEGLTSGNRDPGRHITKYTTKGWEATCKCGKEPAPAIVGDMFAGTGTTLAVAREHGRVAIGCDIDTRNLEFIQKRMANTQPTLASAFLGDALE